MISRTLTSGLLSWQRFRVSREVERGRNWSQMAGFVLEPKVLDYIMGNETVWEREPIGATGARRRTFGVQAFRVLAADGYFA
jgi:hypothetical protein